MDPEAKVAKPINETAADMLARAREETAQVGSTVQLRTGEGPRMKVTAASADYLVCEYIADDMKTVTTFTRDILTVVD